jgi:glycosyltransferase involved in cell wall biosynthesis
VFRKYLWLPVAWFASFLEKDLMPFVYRKKKFVTISESTRNEMLAHGFTDKVEIVYPGTETYETDLYVKSEIPTILYLGRLKAYKSVYVLIRAYEGFRKKYISRSRLVIAGSGEEEVYLKDLVTKLGLNECVEFLGYVDEIQKVKLMSEAWVFVNPSMMEGWGLTVIDANACGTVVVASDVPGLRESVKHLETGLLFEYGDEKMLCDAMYELVTNEQDRLKYEKNARNWAEKFDWNVMAEKFLQIMES